MGLKEAEYIVEIIKTKKNPLSCISAGSSADCVFSALVKLYEEGKVNFKNVKFAGVDEWCGCIRYERTCQWMLDNALFKHIDVKEENMRFFNSNPEDREKNVLKWRSLSKIMVVLTACFWVWEQTGIWHLMNQAVIYTAGHTAAVLRGS